MVFYNTHLNIFSSFSIQLLNLLKKTVEENINAIRVVDKNASYVEADASKNGGH